MVMTTVATNTIKEMWNFGALYLLSGSSRFEEQFDLHKLETVLFTWLVRNNDNHNAIETGASGFPGPELGHYILELEEKECCNSFSCFEILLTSFTQ